MAGIYFHIPFCKKACNYCDFHFSTQLQFKDEMLVALQKELVLRKTYLEGLPVNTVYFGGGTPSVLGAEAIGSLIDELRANFDLAPDAEITLEANPDDLREEGCVKKLKAVGINRLSIGIQSFFDEHLKWMNRAHNADDAHRAVQLAKNEGISNITIDLIYGLPNLSHEQWEVNLNKAIALNVDHISAYCLTVEERTVLHKWVQEGKLKEMPDEEVEKQVNLMCEMLNGAGFERYEISNFAKPGFHSRHNSAYWSGEWYLGIGPSAHSYNGSGREWNVANNALYTRAVMHKGELCEYEEIDETTAYNEYIMTRLRTAKGVDLAEVKEKFLIDLKADFEEEIQYLLEDEEAVIDGNRLKLTHKGMFFADAIAASLFLERDES